MTKPDLEPELGLEQFGDNPVTMDIYRPAGQRPDLIRNVTLREGLDQVIADPNPIDAFGVIVRVKAGHGDVPGWSITDQAYVRDLVVARKRERG